MRIAFDYQIFFLQSYGGISRYFVLLAEQLIAKNINIGIFAPFYKNHYLKRLTTNVVHGYAFSAYPQRSSFLMRQLNNMFSNNAINNWNPQIVHETYYSKKGSAPKGSLTVITVYDMIQELFADSFYAHSNTTNLKKIAIERADHVICISENTRQDLFRLFGTKENKVSVVHLGVENSLLDYQVKKNQQLRPYILFVAARGAYKNFDRFVQAFASSKRLKNEFDIIAFGGGKFSFSEIALFSKLGLKIDQVRQISGDDTFLNQLYDQATAFVYPSLYEGFGLPPLEAMARNCPVISSNTSSMPEVLGDAAEFFDPTKNDDIATAIERVVFSSSRTDQLIKLGQKRIKNFSWEHCGDQTIDIYRSL